MDAQDLVGVREGQLVGEVAGGVVVAEVGG